MIRPIWHVVIKDRRGGGFEVIADFLIIGEDEDTVRRAVKAAYPHALEHLITEVT